jgi:peptidyl-tRNA hydrolase, PTH2 family
VCNNSYEIGLDCLTAALFIIVGTMSASAVASMLNKQVPLWQVLSLAVVVGIGHHFLCIKCSPPCATTKHSSNTDDVAEVPPPTASAAATESNSVAVAPTEATIDETCVDDSQQYSDDDDDDDDCTPFKTDWLFFDGRYDIVDEYTREDGPAKMVLCVNMELKMGKGKIAAQCGHATLGAYKLSRKYCRTGLNSWESTGTTKVAVKVEKESEFYELLANAKLAGVVCCIVEDAGRTQIAAGSRTVLALGPAPASVIDQISGHLKLL